MRRELAKKVRGTFDELIRRRLPMFKRCAAAGMPPGDRVYSWAASDELAFFIALLLHHQNDAFTLEIAYNTTDNWPSDIFMLSAEDPPQDGAARFRLSRLVPGQERHDHWWWLVAKPNPADFATFMNEEPIARASERVERCVSEAVDQLDAYALPYFQELRQGRRDDTA